MMQGPEDSTDPDDAPDGLDMLRDEAAAYAWIERIVWPQGPVCPRCGRGDRIGALHGASVHLGTYKCYACRKPFSFRSGTPFHASNVSLTRWLQALYLCRDGEIPRPSVLQAALGITAKTAAALRRRLERELSPRRPAKLR